MKRPLIATAILLSTALSAHATYTYRYDDVRNKTQHDSNATATEKCDPSHQQAYESRQFNRCMRSLGWRFSHVEHIRDGSSSDDSANWSSLGNDTSSPSTPPPPDIAQPPATYEPPAPVDIHPFCPNTIC
jgi:hypothetical protein